MRADGMAMRFDLIAHRWADYEPPGLCHTGIEEVVLPLLAGAGAAAPEAGALLAAPAVAGTSLGATALTAGAADAAVAGAGASLLPSLSTIGTVASLGGTAIQAGAQARNADYQQKVAQAESDALAAKANEDAAAGQRTAITQSRRTDLVLSRARALSAASGAGATDPTELTTEGGIAQQGDYNALSSLYEGQNRARNDTYQGSIDLFKGQQAEAALPYQIGGTLLSGLSSFATNKAQLRYYARVGGMPYASGF